MARIRSIKPDLFTDDDLGALPIAVRYLYIGLILHADKAGRLDDRPMKLKALILPYDAVDINNGLNQLAAKSYIYRYIVGGRHYLQIRSWDKHQKPHPKEQESTRPEMPELVPAIPGNAGKSQAEPEKKTQDLDPGSLDLVSGSGSLDLVSGSQDLVAGSDARVETPGGDDPKRDPQTGYVVGSARAVARRGGALPGQDSNAAFHCAAFRVPRVLHDEFVGILTNDGIANPQTSLLAWYGQVRDDWKGRRVPSEIFPWLRRQFDAWRGASIAGPAKAMGVKGSRTQDNAAALAAFTAKVLGSEVA